MPRSKILLALLLSVFSWAASGAPDTPKGVLGTAGFAGLSERFVQTVSLAVPADIEVSEVIYGNEDMGFFATKEVHRNPDGALTVRLVPPTYRSPLAFYVRGVRPDKKPVLLTLPQVSFKSPALELMTKNVKTQVLHGSFSSNFFLADLALAGQKVNDAVTVDQPAPKPGDRQRVVYVGIVNRYGEIVWAHAVGDGKRDIDSHTISKPLGGGRYAIMTAQKESSFEIVDLAGKVWATLDPRTVAAPFMIHHDFAMLPSGDILTLGNSLTYVTKGGSKVAEKTSYMGSTVLKVDLAKGEAQQLWDSFSLLDPAKTPMTPNADSEKKDKYHHVWGGPEIDVDYVHANSLSFVPGVGVLLSLRNHDKIVMLDEAAKQVLWTVGGAPSDTFKLAAKDQFHGQHHVTWLGDDRLLLFDNNALGTASRIIELKLDRATGTAQVAKEIRPSPPVHTETRGSAFLGKDGRLTAYFGGKDSAEDPVPGQIIEFNYATGAELARMVLAFQIHLVGYRVVPMQTMGTETYLGKSFPDPVRSEARQKVFRHTLADLLLCGVAPSAATDSSSGHGRRPGAMAASP